MLHCVFPNSLAPLLLCSLSVAGWVVDMVDKGGSGGGVLVLAYLVFLLGKALWEFL